MRDLLTLTGWLDQGVPDMARVLEPYQGAHFLVQVAVARRELISKHMQNPEIDLVGAVGIVGHKKVGASSRSELGKNAFGGVRRGLHRFGPGGGAVIRDSSGLVLLIKSIYST